MKKAMKVLGILLCAVLLVVGSVAATLAYLTSKTAKVTNTFSVGDVEITLTEAKVNESGVPVENKGSAEDPDWTETELAKAYRLDGTDNNVENKYHFMPHIASYTKDPTVTVEAGSDACYVRVMVTVKAESTLANAGTVKFGKGEDAQRGFAYSDFTKHITVDSNWAVQNENADTNGTSVTYEFWYKNGEVVANSDKDTKLEALFSAINGVKPEGSTEYLYDGLYGIESITIEAHAIQSEGFKAEGEKTAVQKAWEAFEVEYNEAQA